MSNPVRIQPDIDFIKDVQAAGGQDMKKCYQCATCSVACPLSPLDNPYPRKEMIWAQWGLKDKLVNDIDIWLCHNCGTCSDLCPRGAKPADLLASLRNMAYKNLVEPKFLGTWMSHPMFLPLLVGIPATIYLLIWLIRSSFFLGGEVFPTTPDGEIVYGLLFPGDYTIDPIFGGVFVFAAWCFYKGVKRMYAAFDAQPKTFTLGYKRPGWWQSLWDVLTKEVVTHSKWKDCGDNESDKERFNGHFTLFYAFVALFIVTSIIAVAHWGGKIVHFLEPIGHTPMPLWSPVKILANVGAVALVAGLVILTNRRLNQDQSKHASSYYDWYLLGVIWVIALTGIGCEILRLANVPMLAYPTYYVHLIAVFMLIAYLPWSKLGHLVYRTAALVYARHTGRLPMVGDEQQEKIFVI